MTMPKSLLLLTDGREKNMDVSNNKTSNSNQKPQERSNSKYREISDTVRRAGKRTTKGINQTSKFVVKRGRSVVPTLRIHKPEPSQSPGLKGWVHDNAMSVAAITGSSKLTTSTRGSMQLHFPHVKDGFSIDVHWVPAILKVGKTAYRHVVRKEYEDVFGPAHLARSSTLAKKTVQVKTIVINIRESQLNTNPFIIFEPDANGTMVFNQAKTEQTAQRVITIRQTFEKMVNDPGQVFGLVAFKDKQLKAADRDVKKFFNVSNHNRQLQGRELEQFNACLDRLSALQAQQNNFNQTLKLVTEQFDKIGQNFANAKQEHRDLTFVEYLHEPNALFAFNQEISVKRAEDIQVFKQLVHRPDTKLATRAYIASALRPKVLMNPILSVYGSALISGLCYSGATYIFMQMAWHHSALTQSFIQIGQAGWENVAHKIFKDLPKNEVPNNQFMQRLGTSATHMAIFLAGSLIVGGVLGVTGPLLNLGKMVAATPGIMNLTEQVHSLFPNEMPANVRKLLAEAILSRLQTGNN